jgi:thiosulfate dehydrogenase
MRLIAGVLTGAAIGVAATLLVLRTPDEPASAPAPPRPAPAAAFQPPLVEDAPAGPAGDAIRLGARLITDTRAEAPGHVGNALACRNCHLDAGRQPGAAPLWAAFVNFPAWRSKNNEINSFQKRVQDCFLYSMNGDPPALGSRELLAIESYAAYMARGLPSGVSPPGRGFPKLPAPARAPDDARGAAVYAEVCAVCHGPEGAGQMIDGVQAFPPLWGARSYNWGAGMATIDKAAAFIHANMPPGQPDTLSVQQAWDVAHFVDGHIRPQDPRYAISPQATRARHHDQPFSRYGTLVAGQRLGDPATAPPFSVVQK